MKKARITFEGLTLEVSFYYEPAEDPSYIYPGAGENYEIRSIKYEGKEVLPIYESLDLLEEIEEYL
jgi:hypothetical protein